MSRALGTSPDALSSAHDARFGTSAPLTVGIEEELMLLDARTLALAPRADEVIDAVAGSPIAVHVQREAMQGFIEITTTVCASVAEAGLQLQHVRRELARVLAPMGLRIAGAGTHPSATAEQQRFSSADRYRSIVDELQYLARREVCFGLHVHLGMPDGDACMRVLRRLSDEVALLIALSANSPFWRGADTGLASMRTIVNAAIPRSGRPPRFGSYADFAGAVAMLERTGMVPDYTHLWWDVRPHPRLGTVEVRVLDAQADLRRSLSLAAYVQAAAAAALDPAHADPAQEAMREVVAAENRWHAARRGVDARLLDVTAAGLVRIPVRTLVRRRVRGLREHARDLGTEELLERLGAPGEPRSPATEQRRVWAVNHDHAELVAHLADRTEAG